MMHRALLCLAGLTALVWGGLQIAYIIERADLRRVDALKTARAAQGEAIKAGTELISRFETQVVEVRDKKTAIAKAGRHHRNSLEKITHENTEAAAWADQPLPADVAGMLDNTGDTDNSLDGYLERLRAREPVPAASGQAKEQSRPAGPAAGDTGVVGDVCGGSGRDCPLPAAAQP